jgi:8-oxo-(d)GTP phosphatase
MAKEKPSIFAAGVALIDKTKYSKKLAVIHRPYRSDWTLPKGKIELDEIPQLAAIRELKEETGLDCILKNPLESRLYYKEEELKKVYYWRASLKGQADFVINEEVDELIWCNAGQLKNKLTYPDDVELATTALGQTDTSPIILLRHAQAEKRADWSDRYQKRPPTDTVRPLTKSGFLQTELISQLLHAYGITKVISSDATRCIATITKFAAEINQPIHAFQSLNEFGWQTNPSPALALLSDALKDPTPQVICGHRPALPEIAQFIESQFDSVPLDASLAPGAMLVIHRTFHKGTISIKNVEEINIPN